MTIFIDESRRESQSADDIVIFGISHKALSERCS